MIDSLYILDQKRTIIIEKHYKKPQIASNLIHRLINSDFIVKTGNCVLMTVPVNNLLFVSLVSSEAPPLGVFYFTEQLLQLFKDYFTDINDQILKDNFDIVYQILQEIIDNGEPYITEPCLLKQLVPPPSLLTRVINTIYQEKAPTSAVSTISWRQLGVNGIVFGQVECLCRLSGMPELILHTTGLKDSISFHKSVDIEKFNQGKGITFIPPDGSFQLLNYTMDINQNQIPFTIRANLIKSSNSKLEVSVNTKSHSFETLIISCTLPNANIVSSNATFTNKQLVWNGDGKLGVFIDGKIDFLVLNVEFRVNMTSLVRIDSLNVQNEAYKPFKGGRSFIKSGRFQVRVD
ncbi:AP-3 complex subunit mu-2 [Boothiomyces macroporosus]|uniref:AP-3 complex subunit mu-2 n=1 Tax=Boothiomyces macroporosus TaxID=261099 RepID=A0AAD5Y3H2_9FUNG|nr:AP-3 complex subunit mu-2 [Boothiomyces macroporosus]